MEKVIREKFPAANIEVSIVSGPAAATMAGLIEKGTLTRYELFDPKIPNPWPRPFGHRLFVYCLT